MEKSISLTDVARGLDRLLSSLRQGNSFVVVEEGKPVARIIPPAGNEEAEKNESRRKFLADLDSRPALKLRKKWTREELYDDSEQYAAFLKELRNTPTSNAGKWTRHEMYGD